MEDDKKINWLGLFIKMVIIFVFVIIIIWLLSKIIGSNKTSEVFTNNLNNMEKVAIDYFKTVDLPLKKGKSQKITLGEMIDKELIVSINTESKNTCDTKNSYSKITRKDKNYVVETTLKCGKEKDTKVSKFSFKDCKNCNANNTSTDKTKSDTKEDKNNQTKNNEVKNDTNTSNNKIKYYEYVKESVSYTKWMRGPITGANIENKYEYYQVAENTYYTLEYIKEDELNKEFTYTIKLDNVPNSKYYFMTVKESKYYQNNNSNYLNSKNTSIISGNKITLSKYTDISNDSLKEGNFTYKLTPYYRNGQFLVAVTIKVDNTNNVSKYYDKDIKKNVYFIPLEINIKFASDEILNTKPTSGSYETISYYRYVTTKREVIWSQEENLDGYTKTGNTKYE